MTLNVGNGLAEPQRLSTVLRNSTADIIGLQELAAPQAQALASDLVDLYPYQVLVPSGFSGKGILSRLPISHHELLPLYPDRPDLLASIEIEEHPLSIIVAHPPPPRVRGTRLVFDSDTRAQLSALTSAAIEHAPTVLLGDFNMTRRNVEYARFCSTGLSDAFAVAGVGRGWTLPKRVGYAARFNHQLHRLPLTPMARVDYVWYTAHLTAEAAWVGADAGSDHLPVLARLALART
jgi:endonuclease/exonuclease/phosphatase family metal-dependent hydrolase